MNSTGASPMELLTTRTRAAVGAVVTAYVLALAIRHLLHSPQPDSGWLITSAFLPRWLPPILNLFFYAVFCWMAITYTRAARGRERFFMLGWFTAILLSPFRSLGLRWSLTISYISALALGAALLAATSLALQRPNFPGSRETHQKERGAR